MAKKRAPVGNGEKSAKRVKDSILAVPRKPKDEAAADLETFEDALEVETKSTQGMEVRRGNLEENCNEEPRKGSFAGNDGDFHSQCSETHDNAHSP